MKKQDAFIVWPVYFDQNKTRSAGRRIPKSQAQPAPRLDEVQKAVLKLGLRVEVRADVAYPGQPWVKSGLVLVGKKGSKLELLKRISKELAVQRGRQQS